VRSCRAPGDDVQALKAGIMEIADVFVVNKPTVTAHDRRPRSIGYDAISLEEWANEGVGGHPCLRTVATTGVGVKRGGGGRFRCCFERARGPSVGGGKRGVAH
jgi:putative protein kinase ArgK-like GTPase of G3E family